MRIGAGGRRKEQPGRARCATISPGGAIPIRRQGLTSMRDVVAFILGGGRGTRLLPLTENRCKPAVPVGGKYRLVDIPISNAINSDIRRIFVLTQYRSASLNRHISMTYAFDSFSQGFVDVLAADQTLEEGEGWFQGAADAVRRNLHVLSEHHDHDVLVMAGDILVRQDLRKVINYHRSRAADVTILVAPVSEDEAMRFGVVKVDHHTQVAEYIEKPVKSALADMAVASEHLRRFSIDIDQRPYLASMGIYVFRQSVLRALLRDEKVLDFGHDLFPTAPKQCRVYAYPFDGYWKDLGTIESFYKANIELTRMPPRFSFYDLEFPIYTRPRYLPPSKLLDCHVTESLISEGCLIRGASISQSIVGMRSIIHEGARIERSILMGADGYLSSQVHGYSVAEPAGEGPEFGVGRGAYINGAIIDKNVRIGAGCRIANDAGVQNADGDYYAIRDGVIIIRKNSAIPDGTIL